MTGRTTISDLPTQHPQPRATQPRATQPRATQLRATQLRAAQLRVACVIVIATCLQACSGDGTGLDSLGQPTSGIESSAETSQSTTNNPTGNNTASNNTPNETTANVVLSDSESNPAYVGIQTNVFNVSCAFSGCHSGNTAPFGLNLDNGSSFNNLVNVSSGQQNELMRVKPGDPDNSYLIQKLEGTAASGAQMPLGGTPLDAVTLQSIRNWIVNLTPASNMDAVNNPATGDGTSFEEIQANVFGASCAFSGCHSGADPEEDLRLDPGFAYANLVNVRSDEVNALLVKPGDPDNSYLIQKLEGTAAEGLQMPRNAPPLSPALIQNVRDWIADGALGPNLKSIQSNIFSTRCTTCHSGQSAPAGLILDPGASHQNLVGVNAAFGNRQRVVSGDSESSFLIQKLKGDNLSSNDGVRMPFGGPYLEEKEIRAIALWIDSGAQEHVDPTLNVNDDDDDDDDDDEHDDDDDIDDD